MRTPFHQELSDWLKSAKISSQALADAIGVSESVVKKWRSEKTPDVPDGEQAKRLATFLQSKGIAPYHRVMLSAGRAWVLKQPEPVQMWFRDCVENELKKYRDPTDPRMWVDFRSGRPGIRPDDGVKALSELNSYELRRARPPNWPQAANSIRGLAVLLVGRQPRRLDDDLAWDTGENPADHVGDALRLIAVMPGRCVLPLARSHA